MIWFISDTHFGHKNMCYGVSEWENKVANTRPFNSLEEMNWAIVNSINNYVKEDDILYHLGDWSFGGIENIWNFRKRLVCKNIYLVPGNHDHHIKKNRILPNCHNPSVYVEDNPESLLYRQVPAQDLFNMLPELTTITYKKKLFVLSHYPLEQWEDMDKGSIMVHGHCHHTIDDCEMNKNYRRKDIGIDWKEFRPFSIDEIMNTMILKDNKTHIKN